MNLPINLKPFKFPDGEYEFKGGRWLKRGQPVKVKKFGTGGDVDGGADSDVGGLGNDGQQSNGTESSGGVGSDPRGGEGPAAPSGGETAGERGGEASAGADAESAGAAEAAAAADAAAEAKAESDKADARSVAEARDSPNGQLAGGEGSDNVAGGQQTASQPTADPLGAVSAAYPGSDIDNLSGPNDVVNLDSSAPMPAPEDPTVRSDALPAVDVLADLTGYGQGQLGAFTTSNLGVAPMPGYVEENVAPPSAALTTTMPMPDVPAWSTSLLDPAIERVMPSEGALQARTRELSLAAMGQSIKNIESRGGLYGIQGKRLADGDIALGAYQIMQSNIINPRNNWDKKHLGFDVTPQELLNSKPYQDAIFRGQMGQYIDQFGPEKAARAWYGGPGRVEKELEKKDIHGKLDVKGYGSRAYQDYLSYMDDPSTIPGYGGTAVAAIGGMNSAPINVSVTPQKDVPLPPERPRENYIGQTSFANPGVPMGMPDLPAEQLLGNYGNEIIGSFGGFNDPLQDNREFGGKAQLGSERVTGGGGSDRLGRDEPDDLGIMGSEGTNQLASIDVTDGLPITGMEGQNAFTIGKDETLSPFEGRNNLGLGEGPYSPSSPGPVGGLLGGLDAMKQSPVIAGNYGTDNLDIYNDRIEFDNIRAPGTDYRGKTMDDVLEGLGLKDQRLSTNVEVRPSTARNPDDIISEIREITSKEKPSLADLAKRDMLLEEMTKQKLDELETQQYYDHYFAGQDVPFNTDPNAPPVDYGTSYPEFSVEEALGTDREHGRKSFPEASITGSAGRNAYDGQVPDNLLSPSDLSPSGYALGTEGAWPTPDTNALSLQDRMTELARSYEPSGYSAGTGMGTSQNLDFNAPSAQARLDQERAAFKEQQGVNYATNQALNIANNVDFDKLAADLQSQMRMEQSIPAIQEAMKTLPGSSLPNFSVPNTMPGRSLPNMTMPEVPVSPMPPAQNIPAPPTVAAPQPEVGQPPARKEAAPSKQQAQTSTPNKPGWGGKAVGFGIDALIGMLPGVGMVNMASRALTGNSFGSLAVDAWNNPSKYNMAMGPLNTDISGGEWYQVPQPVPVDKPQDDKEKPRDPLHPPAIVYNDKMFYGDDPYQT